MSHLKPRQLLLAVSLTAALAACGKSNPPEQTDTASPPSATNPSTAANPPTAGTPPDATTGNPAAAGTGMSGSDTGTGTGGVNDSMAPGGTTTGGKSLDTPPGAGGTGTGTTGSDIGGTGMAGTTGAMGTAGSAASAGSVTVNMKLLNDKGTGADAGTVTLSEGAGGVMVKTDLKGLPPGEHGFHVHQNPDCGPKMKDGKMMAGEAAGEHVDPAGTGKHAGPDGPGHAGDLPRITVGSDGTAKTSFTVAKLKMSDARNRSLIVHSGRDDYGAAPGGARVACGIIGG